MLLLLLLIRCMVAPHREAGLLRAMASVRVLWREMFMFSDAFVSLCFGDLVCLDCRVGVFVLQMMTLREMQRKERKAVHQDQTTSHA